MIKQEVYEFSGGCKHSGNCCRGLMLYENGSPIDSVEQWKQYVKTHSEYATFIPQVKSHFIQQFDCSSLTCDNQCDRYQDRPKMCRNYPYSFFYQHGYIHNSCGYNVQKNEHNYHRLFSIIRYDLSLFSSV